MLGSFIVGRLSSSFFDSCIIIAIDDGRVDFAKVGGTVCMVADAVGRDILIFDVVWVIASSFSCGTNRSTGAFSINVCVDNGIASAAVDVDVTSSATVSSYNSANCRADVTGSIIWAVIRTNGIDCIYGAAGDVDGCCDSIDASRSSDCGMITGTDSGNVGILSILIVRSEALPYRPSPMALLSSLSAVTVAFPEIVIVLGLL